MEEIARVRCCVAYCSILAERAQLRIALAEYKSNYATLQALRHTDPEKKLDVLMKSAEQRRTASDGRLKESQAEVERLRKHTALWREGVDVVKEVDKRELECDRLKEEVRGLKKEVVLRDEMVKSAQDRQGKAEEDGSSAIDLHFLSAALIYYARTVIHLEKALKFESEQSKVAATQLKELQANPSKVSTATRNDSASQSNDAQERYRLISDLTGVTIQRITHTGDGQQYDCLLVDASRKRGLGKLHTLPTAIITQI